MPDINVFYKRSDNFTVFPVGGVWGGITPQGLISAEFFIDKPASPEHTVLKLDETGEAKETVPDRQDITRELLVGLIANPEIARIIGNWLITRADEVDKIRIGAKK